MTPIVAVSGPSGVGKTRLLARLVAELTRRGVRVGILKHTGHDHPFDVPGKDTEVLRRAGAVAAAIEGPSGMAYFGPPAGGARALARLLPPVDLVLAEGWKREPLPKVEVYRRAVSPAFLCASDRRVFAVVTDTPPPRRIPTFDADDPAPLADLLCARLGLARPPPRRKRLPGRPDVRSVHAEGSERPIALGRRTDMAKTTSRTSRRGGGTRSGGKKTTARSGGARTRSAAGRKGGSATLRARGPEFYSEIGRKGGRSRARSAAARAGGRSGGRSGGRAGSRSGGAKGTPRRSSRGTGRRSK